MPILSQPAFGPRTALAYVTGGSLIAVWTLVWFFTREHEMTKNSWFWVSGFFLTGLTLISLGLLLGPLGRKARQAELPPPEAISAEATIQNTAAANPPAVASVNAPTPATPMIPPAPAGLVNPPAAMRVG